MMNINLIFQSGIAWTHVVETEVDVWVKGLSFKNGKLFKGHHFAKLFLFAVINGKKEQNIFKKLQTNLLKMNGSFAVVVQGKGWIFASVDRTRAIPLYYGKKGDGFYLSDNANWVRNQVANSQMDKIATKEFLLTGYVTGSETLFPKVKQLQAGECIWVRDRQGIPEDSTYRFHPHTRQDFFDASEEEIYSLLDQVLVNVFERLIESTRNHRLVVPLSGGIDSISIVAMLKRLGRENVICFSYGRKGNWESEISKSVAKTLGYHWEFIHYTRRKWYQWFQSDERQHYYQYADGLSSLAHIQDWPAVWELKKAGKIPEDAVFVPGHTAVLISDRLDVKRLSSVPKEQWADVVAENLFSHHYNLWTVDNSYEYRNLLLKRIKSNLLSISPYTINDALNILYFFESAERHAKFINNSVRVYEFWGYDWRIPLWDNEMMDFWAKVPLDLRIGKKLYSNYCSKKNFYNLFPDEVIKQNLFLNLIKNNLKKENKLSLLLSGLNTKNRMFLQYWTHLHQWYGFVSYYDWIKKFHKASSINSFLVQRYIDECSKQK